MKEYFKSLFRNNPRVFSAGKYFYNKLVYFIYKRLPTKAIFINIYNKNIWGDSDSVSGAGSNLYETKKLVKELPKIFSTYDISSILDTPCGDFHWMKLVNMSGIDYTGGDIVPDIVKHNLKYEKSNINFKVIDLITSDLPQVDLVFVRDCLVHLSNEDILLAIENICNSGARYLFTTTFTGREFNEDIASGQWRTLNLQISPFNFPEPVLIFNENHPKSKWSDKSLGLWRVEDLMKCLGLSVQN